LLPNGVPVPCTWLIAADPETASDILSKELLHGHLASSRNAKALWLSLENSTDDLRIEINAAGINEHQLEFIDCYSSQLGVNSLERYSADPTNLPHLAMVTSKALSNLNGNGNLLVILDSLSSLIRKVGLRGSTEFFRVLRGKTRSINASLLTSINRAAFTEAVLATYVEIADVVVELVCASPTNRLRVRKARNLNYDSSWLPYQVDCER
jgi:archaellum biogenesis ATPase FlaH